MNEQLPDPDGADQWRLAAGDDAVHPTLLAALSRKRSSIGLSIAFRAPRANCGRWGYSEATELAHYIMDHRAYHSDFVEACQHRRSYP